MKKLIIYLGLILMANCFLTGCIKDDSTSFQIDMPDVTIAPDDAIAFAVGTEGEYAPTIDWAGTDPADYDFLWTYNGREELSREQVLRHTFTEAGTFYLTFQMTDRNTKLVYGRDFKMTVSSPFFLGWLILSENDDKSSSLSFVHMTSFESYPDIYKSLYPNDPLGSEPYRMEFHAISKTDQILVMQKGGDGLVEIDGSNLQKVIRTENEFIGEQYPDEDGGFNPVRVAYTHKGPELLLTDKGNIYDRITPSTATVSSAKFQSAMYSTVPFSHVAGPAKFTYFTFPGACNYQLMFDDLNKRWLAYYNTTTIPKAIPELIANYGDKPEVFDFCTGMGSDVDLVYAESFNEATNRCALFNVLKQNGTYYVAQSLMNLSTTNYSITVSSADQRVFTPAVDDQSRYCLMRGSGTSYAADPHLFYSIGKKVYFYHWDTDRSYLYKDFSTGTNAPSGELVSILQNGNATQVAFAFSDGHFYICDANKTTLTNIRQGNIDPTGENEIELAHIDNIPGRIVHAIFKYGKASNYTGAKIAY